LLQTKGVRMLKTDVLIIGGGISGVAIARELSRYEDDATLVEREVDVGWGQSKAGYAIRHPGVRWPPGSTAQQMIVQGNQLMDQLIKDLDIEFKQTGELVLAFDKEELASLEKMKSQGDQIKVQGLEIIDTNELRRLEPRVNPAAIAALYMPTAGVFNPFDLLYAFYENARDNGVHMMMDTEVLGIIPEKGRFIVRTTQGEIQTDTVVNAAGLLADKVAQMAGTGDFRITSNSKGSCLILDTLLGDVVHHIVTGLHDPKALMRYKLVTPTFHDKILIYTSFSEPARGIEDRAVTKRIFDLTVKHARDLVPGVDFEHHIIAAFSSIAAKNDRGDFIIECSQKYPGLIHAAPTPPGLTASPAIGRRVVEILKKSGIDLREKENFNPCRSSAKSLRKLSPTQISGLVDQDPRYGRVICRCEQITEGEIVDAVKRGATTLDGIKFRTRASMGKCQSNYCSPALANILARELNQPLSNITKKGRGSNYAAPK
jgi:glycerol-3-phosphate dehydrogenase